jgi:mannose-6-phosphate isomerase-like protein (cupin superfamily)
MTIRGVLTTVVMIGFGLAAAAGSRAQGAPPAGGDDMRQWTTAELIARAEALPINNERKQGILALAMWGNHLANLERLEGRTEGEVHLKRADIIHILSGRLTMTVGGALADARNSSATELRGTIKGGAIKTLSPGDFLHIPANTPHQLDAEGKQVTFIVFKVEQP